MHTPNLRLKQFIRNPRSKHYPGKGNYNEQTHCNELNKLYRTRLPKCKIQKFKVTDFSVKGKKTLKRFEDDLKALKLVQGGVGGVAA